MNEFLVKLLVVILLIIFFILRNRHVKYYKKSSYKFLIKYIIIIFIMLLYFYKIIDFALIDLNIYFRLICGLLLILIGYLLFFWAHRYLGKNWSSLLDKKLSKKDRLIKEGPYRFVRHPTYSASILTLMGFGILTANWLIFFISLIILVSFYAYKVPREEKFLISKFGKDYLEYRKKTGGFIPKLF